MSTNLEEIVENNWSQLEETIKNKWNKLTAQDIKQIEGSYDILVGKIKKLYGGTRKEIESELDNITNNLKCDKDAGDQIISIKEIVQEHAKDYLESIKNKSVEFEQNVVSYTKENPIKIFAMAAAIFYVCKRMRSNR